MFWSAGTVALTSQLSVTADQSCIVLVDETGANPQVSVSRYNAATVQITLNYGGGSTEALSFNLLGGAEAGKSVTKTATGGSSGSTLVNDPFSDGAVTGATGSGDPSDIHWTAVGTAATPVYTTQFATSGNTTGALLFSASNTWGAIKGSGAAFASTHALAEGEAIAFSCDFRSVPSTLPSHASGLRMGLGSSAGTYGLAMGTGGTAGGSLHVYPADAISGTAVNLATSGSAISISNSSPHSFQLVLTRTGPTSLSIEASVDGNTYSATHTGVSVFTFDRVILGEPGVKFNFHVDNVVVGFE